VVYALPVSGAEGVGNYSSSCLQRAGKAFDVYFGKQLR